jgi:hypothetical protein
MGCISINANQAGVLRAILENVPFGHEIWIHSELESVFVEEETSQGNSVRKFRVFESGGVTIIPKEDLQ